jgi:hypothetical protein
MTETSNTARIAALNDRFRTEGPRSGIPGHTALTNAIGELPIPIIQRVLEAVAAFNSFEPGDDPHGEHDFGAIDIDGAGKVFWKIDYYAPDMENGSEDPADLTKTVRVLTVMLASDY